MHADLLFGMGGLVSYALLPTQWKKIFWVNLSILVPTAAVIIRSQLVSGYSLPQLGIRTDNWLAGLGTVAAFIAFAATILLLAGRELRRLRWTRNMTISVIVYPIWGVAQQFLILSFINVRLMELHWPIGVVALVTGLAFMALHVPDMKLMPATLVLGICFSFFFQTEPNILTLGIAHGWLGALYYFWVLGRDPITEKFGRKNSANALV